MIDSSPQQPIEVIGREGLATTLENAASQISAVEKQTNLQLAATNTAITAGDANIREVLDIHMAYRAELLSLHVDYLKQLEAERNVAHDALHKQEHEERKVALNNLNSRMTGFPQEFASQSLVKDMGDRLTRFETDTRIRFEQSERRTVEGQQELERKLVASMALIEKRLNEGLTLVGERARQEGRPGQDLRTSQGAVIAAIIFAAVVIGAVIAVMTFVGS